MGDSDMGLGDVGPSRRTCNTNGGAMRISRSCWDKPRRCPGWAGAGWNYRAALAERTYCHNGSVTFPHRWWSLGVCDECGVRVLPYWTRLLFPTYYWGMRGIYKMRLLWRVNLVGWRLMGVPQLYDEDTGFDTRHWRWWIYRLGEGLHRL